MHLKKGPGKGSQIFCLALNLYIPSDLLPFANCRFSTQPLTWAPRQQHSSPSSSARHPDPLAEPKTCKLQLCFKWNISSGPSGSRKTSKRFARSCDPPLFSPSFSGKSLRKYHPPPFSGHPHTKKYRVSPKHPLLPGDHVGQLPLFAADDHQIPLPQGICLLTTGAWPGWLGYHAAPNKCFRNQQPNRSKKAQHHSHGSPVTPGTAT